MNLPNGWEAVIEYIAAWLFGLLVFQALFMRSMYSSYWEAVKRCVFAETVSMNFIMAGMIPVVLILKHYYPKGSDPLTLEFWGIMSAATLVGFLFAYPINSWMVKKGIKHGMMSAKKVSMPMPSQHEMPKQQHPWVVIGSFAFFFLIAYLSSYLAPVRF
jgi:Domain of unknown function (DUF4396)